LGKYFNQRGYALLIVLLTIIIFLSLSAVFISASFNHVKQEKTVDKNNQSVVAAEMGIKHITSDIQNRIYEELKNIESYVNIRKNTLKECANNNNCSEEDIKTLQNEITQRIIKFDNYIKELLVEDISAEYTSTEIDENISFYLTFIDVNYDEVDSQYNIAIDVKGESETTLSATLTLDSINYFLNENNSEMIPITVTNNNSDYKYFPTEPLDNESCSQLLSSISNSTPKPYNCYLDTSIYQLVNLIEKSNKEIVEEDFNVFIEDIHDAHFNGNVKDITKLNIFKVGNWDFKNINKLKYAQLYVTELFEAHVGNNVGNPRIGLEEKFDIKIVAKSLEIKKLDVKNTLIAVLGNSKSKGYFNLENNSNYNGNKSFLNLDKDSIFCINLDNVDYDPKDFQLIKGEGKVYYHSTKPVIDIVKATNSSPTYEGFTEYEFLNKCGVDSFKLSDNVIKMPKIPDVIPGPSLVEVKYIKNSR